MGDWSGSSWHLSLCGLFHPQHLQHTTTRLLTVLTFCRFHRLGHTLHPAQSKAQSCWLPLLVSKQFENSMEGRINPWSFRSGWGHPESLLEALPYLATIIPVCALTGGQGRPVIQGIETVLHNIQEQGLAGRLKTFPNQTIVTTCHTGTRGGENCFKHFLQ